MMEAISFGVPVVAVGVNGVPEIVTPQTGVLMDEHTTLDEMARGLASVLHGLRTRYGSAILRRELRRTHELQRLRR